LTFRRRLPLPRYRIEWLGDSRPYTNACPACGSARAKRAILRARASSHLARWLRLRRPITLLACPECESVFCDRLKSLAYERQTRHPWAADFYVEQGAAIDALIEPIARLATEPVHRLLELGCGYGFALDAAQRLFGWESLGMDPSPLAAAGREVLGVSIQSGYASAQSALGGRFGLVYASEVIEHVEAPDQFLRICQAHLAPDGVLALSTPDAHSIRRDTPPSTLLPALSLGHHLVLFSVKGLAQALRRAGFGHCSVLADGPRLIAYASQRSLQFDTRKALDRSLYRRYLQMLLERSELPLALGIGVRTRLLKELTHSAEYAAAQVAFVELASVIESERQIPVSTESTALLSERIREAGLRARSGVPWCMPVIHYCRGMIELNHLRDHATAARWFESARQLAAACRAVYTAGGMDDGETATLERESHRHALLALSYSDPQAAITRVGDLDDPELAEASWRALVIHLIERGELEQACSAASHALDPNLTWLADGYLALHRTGDIVGAQHAFEGLRAPHAELEPLATQGLMLACTQVDPDRVSEAVERGGLSPTLIEVLFMRLVDLGHVGAAQRLEPMLALHDTWPVQSRIGLIRMLGGAPAEGAIRLLRAFVLARRTGSGASDGDCAQIKYREVLARLQAGDADGAARAAAELLSPEASRWVPAPVREQLVALLEEHPQVRSAVAALAS
jgi:2-polyprenyl-3-methyl-5-hydroxy-6-metoxy-1,4-benzoquinol methylase